MQKMNPQDIKYGYIIVPKTLLTEQFTNCDTHEGEVEAFLKLLRNAAHRLLEQRHSVPKRRKSAQLPQLERHLALVGEQNLPFHTTSAN